jgi:CRISPR/Cas system-associated exonuclease Cas4 (RecB family)
MAIEKLAEDHFLISELRESFVEDWKGKSGQRDHQKRNYFYMSDVAKCDRTTFYDFTCPEKKRPITAKTLMMFAAGNLLHDDLQDRARRRGLVDSARDLEYGVADWAHKATGRLDFIVPVYRFIETEKGVAVVEIKTKNPYNFGEEEPTQEEVDQISWYIDRLKEHEAKSLKQTPVLDYGFILYGDRAMISDPLPLCGWRVDFDPARVAVIKARFDTLDKAILANAVPQRPYERESIKCSYCRYKDHCWEGVPLAAPPAFEADETVEAPEMELVESMAESYIKLKAEAKRIDGELEAAHATLMRYFKATGTEILPVNGASIVHSFTKRTELDRDYLASMLADKWQIIAVPQAKLIEQAIKDGLVDPETYERAKQVKYSDSILIKKAKGGNHADQKSE